jgi:hypothetical protein
MLYFIPGTTKEIHKTQSIVFTPTQASLGSTVFSTSPNSFTVRDSSEKPRTGKWEYTAEN